MKKALLLIFVALISFVAISCQETTTSLGYIIINGIADHDVIQGEEVDLLEGVTALDNFDSDFTNQIIISSTDCSIIDEQFLDTSQAGVCEINYSITTEDYQDSITAVYTIIEQSINPDVITVYFQKPVDWTDVQIYYYDANMTYATSWDLAPEMNRYYGHEGWYYFSFPIQITSIKVMFKDSQDHQIPLTGFDGEEIDSSIWIFDDFYSYTSFDPFELANSNLPQIAVTSNNSVFSNSLEITIDITSSSEITEMYYVVNDVEVPIANLHTNINLGSEFYLGERVMIVVYATNADGTVESYTYLFIKNTPTNFVPLPINEDFNKLSIYQIYVDAYQNGSSVGYSIGYGPSNHHGDLQGIINALDYIASLNVNAIWLTPIFTSKANSSYSEWEVRGRSTGYYADDYFHIDPNFGTDELFKELVDLAHEKGLYVFLDGVFGHHGSYRITGVTDGASQWYGYETVFPESLDYFINVVQYWILEYGIDGWRLDQSYQLYQDNYNYWRDIRIAVQRASDARAAHGETWGTLGYLVGEDWESVQSMNLHAYSGNGLPSTFDFPLRYAIVASLAMDESYWNASFYDINTAMNSPYVSYAQPNLFITNHDVVRFGDLLQLSDKDGNEYYQRHKMALSFLAQYTGPITIYYGDEYGDEFTGLINGFDDLNTYGDIAIDNVARTNGKISGFDSLQLDLIDYTSRILELRNEYSAMYNGIRTNLYVDSNLYIDLKTAPDNIILYGLNRLSTLQNKTFTDTELGGTKLINLLTGEVIFADNHVFTVPFSGLSAMFYLVTD